MRAPIKPLPSVEVLETLFAYDPETGELHWKPRTSPGFNRSGRIAGTIGPSHGYLVVGIEGTYYYAHRIIWKIMTGCDPCDQIDHRDLDRINNRWSNLREANNGTNKRNSTRYKNNKSGVKGVCWDSYHQKWRAYISTNGRQHKLGRFSSLTDAAAVVSQARARMHGDWARAV